MTDPRTIALENALKALGINPDNDPLHHAKRWISGRDDDRRERDQALTERDNATARVSARELRIADLERDLAAAHKQADANLKWGEAYKGALDLYFEKMGLNQSWSLDRRMEHVAKVCGAWTALTRICEVIGAPAPCVADDAVEAVTTLFGASEYAEARAEAAEATLKGITQALDDAGAPMLYTGTTDPNGIPIPDPERIRLLGERVRGEHAERIREGDNVQVYRDRLAAAERALDDRDAPRFADGTPLSPAARIRALPR